MIRNFLKTAFRNLWRNRGFTAINIFGLAIGIATCLVIVLFVLNELSYDRFHVKADRIYRVTFGGVVEGGELKEAVTMPPVAQALKTDFPEVEQATRLRDYGRPRLRYQNNMYKDDPLGFVDSNFFQVFSFPLIKGNPATALVEPNSIVITTAVAKKYFGNEDPMGKMIEFPDQHASLKVTGLINEMPTSSHFRYSILGSLASIPDARDPSWMTSNFYTYVLLAKGVDYHKINERLPGLFEKYVGPQMVQAMGMTIEQFKANGNHLGLHLQRLTDIHLHSDLTGDIAVHGDIRYVYIFTAVAIFILLIACINFMNLATAKASSRAKEICVRKVIGSGKGQLIRQFLLESLLLTSIGLILAIILVFWALPIFSDIAGQDLSEQLRSNPLVLPGLLLFGLLTGVLAGSYPAFFMSSFNPITVLKGKFTYGKGTINLRSGLVVFQFFISIILIVATAVVFNQLSYIQHKKLGYDKNQVVVIPDTWWLGKNQEAYRQQLLADPRIVSVSSSRYLPAGPSNNNNFFVSRDGRASESIKTLRYETDENYIPTLGIEMAFGRNFSRDYGADSTAMILNETAAKLFGWNKEAIGHTIIHRDNDGTSITYHVIGVVKDFHFRSLHEKITPLVMTLGSDFGTMIAKVKTADISGVLSSMKKNWDDFKPEESFFYSFLDDRYNNMYKAEQTIGKVLGIFTSLTILVACLGLFGLATITAEQRTKEIGIRKVLGANVAGIVSLLSKDFLKLVLIAFIIAAPVGWYVMSRWLQDFEYRINLSWTVFALAAVLAIVITLVTVSFQAIRAAIANPVNSLRSE